MVCVLTSKARQNIRCSDFAHGVFTALVCLLAGTEIVLVMLMVCLSPFDVQFVGMGVAPDFVHGVFPLFCA